MAIAARVYDTDCEPKTDPAVSNLISEANYSSQLRLLDQLRQARELCSMSTLEVAKKLHTTVEMVEDIESGDYELNLSELRQIAYAVDSFVEFRVHFNASSKISERLIVHAATLTSRIWRSDNKSPWDGTVTNGRFIAELIDQKLAYYEK